ncbi:hypothetical protein HLK59_13220 [Streptomyces sp. S3(2020)]|uniref:hypothetical protein n=1 Tax=Streptomyces sp. S3(2020) TaxID=2732044 RepID=UPI001489D354|nr:hypothetical protein [Streptomyces sp. S3(2020)]NNN31310.1 hypothetical protein [Streptomyces sp. S3(2020)]
MSRPSPSPPRSSCKPAGNPGSSPDSRTTHRPRRGSPDRRTRDTHAIPPHRGHAPCATAFLLEPLTAKHPLRATTALAALTVAGLTGQVAVVHGSASGPDPAKRKVISQNTPGVPGSAEAYAKFGATLLASDVPGDGRADLTAIVAQENDLAG